MHRIHSAISARAHSLPHNADHNAGTGAVMRILATVMALAVCLALAGCADDDPQPASSACTGNDSTSAYDWPVYEDTLSMSADAAAIYRLKVESCKPAAGRGYDTEITGSVVGQLIVANGGVTRKPLDDEKKATVTIHGYTAEGSGAGPIAIGDEYVFFVGAGDYELNPAQAAMHVPEDVGNDATAIVSADGSLTLNQQIAQELGIVEPTETSMTDARQARLDTVRERVERERAESTDIVDGASWYIDTDSGYDGMTNSVSSADGRYRMDVFGVGRGSAVITLLVNGQEQSVGTFGFSEISGTISTTFDMTSDDNVALRVVPEGEVDAAIGFTVTKVA